MCGRYTITRQEGLIEEMEAVLDPNVEKNQWWKPRFNVAPTQDAPVVTLRDGVRTIEMMRWGLVPFWAAKSGAKPPLMINARIESVDTKRVFKDALERKRCLVPADGFFEWKKLGKKKQPMWIHPEGHRFFAFAGLWARAKLSTGELHSFTIITGPPNELVAPIHDRMPVVLDRSVWSAWLDPSLDLDGARAMLTVPPVEDWQAEPVSTWVNAADHDDAQCIAPVAQDDEPDAKPKQRDLFE
ncbi:MAG TPA: SOS response-associated peptidase [Kofleriaceae bacterium]